MFLISVSPGEEVIESITRQLAERDVANGAIVSLVGAIGACAISNMPKNDATSDIINEYKQPFELSGTGEIKEGVPHIHCVLGTDDADRALAGHLHWAHVDHWFVNAYVIPI
jgi:predicted DNA-binding protein with PD1-like motif